MQLKKNIIIIIMFLVFITSSVAVYFALKYNNKFSKNSLAMDSAIKNTSSDIVPIKNTSNDIESLINEKTEIVITYKYKGGIEKKVVEKPGPELLGRNREGAREYFKENIKYKDFLLTEFSNKRVSLLGQSDTWPPNYYVIKSDNSSIIVYQANDKGELRLEYVDKKIIPQDLPLEDRKIFEEGKACETLDDVNKVLEELES
jgi:hypothetical protein